MVLDFVPSVGPGALAGVERGFMIGAVLDFGLHAFCDISSELQGNKADDDEGKHQFDGVDISTFEGEGKVCDGSAAQRADRSSRGGEHGDEHRGDEAANKETLAWGLGFCLDDFVKAVQGGEGCYGAECHGVVDATDVVSLVVFGQESQDIADKGEQGEEEQSQVYDIQEIAFDEQ